LGYFLKVFNTLIVNDFIQPTLKGKTIELRPLEWHHIPELLSAAEDGQLWNLKTTVVPGPNDVHQYVKTALAQRQARTGMPFVIIQLGTGKVVGSTRFWKLDSSNRKLEIGHTWLSGSVQRSGVNTEAKTLLLTYAFEGLKCVRVQFTTDELNEKSRAAILRIGAKQEGIIRHERIMPDGRKRNSVRFSIIDTEWDSIKLMLNQMAERHKK
jgi:RimJ/RimL family protein N-acetyltransferase